MVDTRISELPLATTPLDGTELVEAVQGGVSVQVETAELGLGGTLDGLTDVDTSTTPPTDAQALVWDDAAGLWVPGDVAAGGGGGGTTALGSKVSKNDTAHTSNTDIIWTTEVYDDLGIVDLATSASLFTITDAGLYHLAASAYLPVTDTNLSLRVNGGNVGWVRGSSSGSAKGQQVSCVLKLQPGDTVAAAVGGTLAGPQPDVTWLAITRLDAPGSGGGGGGGELVLLDSVVLAAAATRIQFFNIPNTYRDLVLVGRTRSDRPSNATDQLNVRLGTGGALDATGNYRWGMVMTGTNPANQQSAAGSSIALLGYMPASAADANVFGQFTAEILDYVTTGRRRDVRASGMAHCTSAIFNNSQVSGAWLNTAAAVDCLEVLFSTGPNFVAGSEVFLYGRGVL